MPLSPAIMLLLASQCAPTVAPETLVSVARVESAFDPLAIGVNGAASKRIHPKSVAEAIGAARRLIADGANIDLGLGQLNVANLGRLGMTVADAFEPCRNLRGAGQLLQEAYQAQSPIPGREQAALRVALSIYNTGRTDLGFRNGYVAKVLASAGVPVPALTPSGSQPTAAPTAGVWDVFAAARSSDAIVFTAAPSGDHP
jgi:type IV secretion system protein VirB1